MSKRSDTWMPWYVADYLADTGHLNTEQHGAYCLMLMAAWKRDGSLKNDDAQMASICRLTPAKWKASREILLDFFQEDGDRFTHKRVTVELEKAKTNSKKKAEAGAEGALKRWQIDDSRMADAIADAITEPQAEASQSYAPSPSPINTNTNEANASSSPAMPPTISVLPNVPDCPHIRLIEVFGERLPSLPQPKPELWSGKSADAMRARWRWLMTAKRGKDGARYATTEDEGVAWMGRFFGYVSKSDFLMGRQGSFVCSLQWLMKADNFNKVVQGNYDNREAA